MRVRFHQTAIVLLCACSYGVEPPETDDSTDLAVTSLWIGLDLSDGALEPTRRAPAFGAPALGAAAFGASTIEYGLSATQVAVVLGDGDPEATPILPPRYGLARRARLDRVSAFQAVAIDLMRDGGVVELRDAPVVEGRDLRLRLYVKDPGGDNLLARVRWTSAGETTLFLLAKSIASDSEDVNPASLFEFDVPAALVTQDAELSAELLEDGGTGFDEVSGARLPQDGAASRLGAVLGRTLELQLVPMAYDHDGSGRLPDVSAEAMDALEARLEAVYPIAAAHVVVGEARSYAAPLAPDSFDDHVDALREVAQWRTDDGAGTDTYYIGLITPEDAFGTYCAAGCYTGIAPLNESNSPFQRVGLVVWYGDTTSGWTALHELGHAHGRPHAPCGAVAGSDPLYPFADGSIGSWGFDQRDNTFVAPSAHDFMSYCSNEWISAYNYSALAGRVQSVAAAASARFEAADPTPHHFVSIEGESVRWRQIDLPPASSRESKVTLHAQGDDARWTVSARRIEFSIDAGFVLVFPIDNAARAYEFEGRQLIVP